MRVLATTAVVTITAGACGGTLEDEYRRNQRTPGSEPPATGTGDGDGSAVSMAEGDVRFFRFGSSSEPGPAAPPEAGKAATPAPAPADPAPGRRVPGPPAPPAGDGPPAPPAAAARQPGVNSSRAAPPAPPAPAPPTEVGVTGTIVRMGGAIPLSGPLGRVGRQELYGFDARVQRVNDAGGIHGRRLKLIVYDTGLDPARERAQLRRLAEADQVFSAFAVGSVRASADYACGDVARLQGQPLPLVADVATLPERQLGPGHRCVFATGPGNAHGAWIRAQRAKRLGATSIGVIMSDDPRWTEADRMAEEAEDIYEAEGLAIRGRERMPVGAAYCDDRARDMLGHNPDYLYLDLVTAEDLKKCTAALRTLAWKGRVATEVALPDDEVAASAGAFAEGFLSTSIFLRPDDPAPAMAEYRADVTRHHPDADLASPVTLGAYLGAKVTEHLLGVAGPNLTRAGFLAAAESLPAWDSGLGPVLTWSPGQRVGTKQVTVLAARGGRFVPTGEVTQSACPERTCAP